MAKDRFNAWKYAVEKEMYPVEESKLDNLRMSGANLSGIITPHVEKNIKKV